MSRFVAGFAVASMLWAVGLSLYVYRTPETVESQDVEDEPEPSTEVADDESAPRFGRPRRGGGSAMKRAAGPLGTAETGDDLDEDAPRTLNAAEEGGEQQLASGQIEAAMGEAFGSLRRCLILAAGDEPATGTLSIGMRIAGDGSVRAVNLRGPASVTTGEAGQCLRAAVRRVGFPAFDGPEMVVRYPITLE